MKASAISPLMLSGDGIGEEITTATLTVLRAADEKFDLNLTYEHDQIGWAAYHATGTTCPDAVLERARQANGILLGPFPIRTIRHVTRWLLGDL